MEIIGRFKPAPKICYRSECRACGIVLKANQTELKFEHDPRDNSSWITGSCPQCKKILYFKETTEDKLT